MGCPQGIRADGKDGWENLLSLWAGISSSKSKVRLLMKVRIAVEMMFILC